MAEPQGNGSPQDPQGSAPPAGAHAGDGAQQKYMTAEEFNAAFTKRAKDLEKSITGKFTESVGSIRTSLDELLTSKLDALKPKPADPPAPEGDGASKGKGGGEGAVAPVAVKDTPEFKAMKKQLDAMTEASKAEAAARAAADARLKDQAMRSETIDAAVSAGVDATRAKVLVGHLIDSAKRVRRSTDGDAIQFIREDGEAVDLKAGIATFLKTDEGKMFLPPTGAKGSGDRPAGSGAQGGANGKITREGLRQAIAQKLLGGG